MKILIVAGGTGGHLYPGIAVARALGGHEVLFVVRRGDLGREILQKEGFPVREISGQGLPRTLSLKWFTFPFKFLSGWVEARALLKELRPDWVVGMGGYLSVPVVVTARLLGIRTLLHEQNVYPGLANRFLSRLADSVAVSFPESDAYFPKGKTWVSGLPIRPDIKLIDQVSARQRFGLDPKKTTYLIFGGSLGAQRLNSIVAEAWKSLGSDPHRGLTPDVPFQVIHVTGTRDFERVQALYRALPVSAKVVPYCHEMAQAYSAADAVICRSGASTVAELLAVKRPALLVPFPYASNNHQVYNAQVLVKAGQGQLVLDKDLNPQRIADFVSSIRSWKLPSISDSAPSDAAARLAKFLKD